MGTITVESVSEFVPNLTTIVNEEGDFPDPEAGVIMLEAGRTYEIGDNVSTPNRLVFADNTVIRGSSAFGPTLTYTGTGDMFTGVDVNAEINNLRMDAPNCNQIYNFSNTVSTTSVIIDLTKIVSTNKVGTFSNQSILSFTRNTTFTCTDGITIGGAGGSVLEIVSVLLNTSATTFTGLDLGTAVYPTLKISEFVNVGTGGAGSIGITGSTNSANVSSGSIATVTGCGFFGSITPLSVLTNSDIRYKYTGNAGIGDSTKTANSFLTSPQTVTIGMAGVFVPVNGVNFSSDVSERFTVTSAGVLTYIAEKDDNFQVSATATVEKVGGGSDELNMRISINGTSESKTTSSTENNSPTTVTSIGVFNLSMNDEITISVANIDGTANITLTNASINIINGF